MFNFSGHETTLVTVGTHTSSDALAYIAAKMVEMCLALLAGWLLAVA